eukprot:1134265-Lingulodinium_polyedra.AAC.1
MLKVPEWNALLAKNNISPIDIDQCQFGTPWKKATRLICSRIDDAGPLVNRGRCAGKKGICSRTGRR